VIKDPHSPDFLKKFSLQKGALMLMLNSASWCPVIWYIQYVWVIYQEIEKLLRSLAWAWYIYHTSSQLLATKYWLIVVKSCQYILHRWFLNVLTSKGLICMEGEWNLYQGQHTYSSIGTLIRPPLGPTGDPKMNVAHALGSRQE